MPEPRFDVTAAPGHLIRRAQQRHQQRWAEFVGEELTSVQFAVLELLAQRPEIDQRTLVQTLSIDTSTLAEVCRRLSDRGLLERTRSERDQRRYVLRVSAGGEALLERKIPAVRDVGEALLAPLDASERTALMALLARVVAA